MMFLDYLYTLPNSTEGIDQIAVQTATAVPSLIPIILLFVFCFVFIGGIIRQKIRIGTSDYPMWATVASLSTMMVALIMTLIPGLIRLDWLVIVVVITIFSGVWLFLDKRRGEL